MAGYNLIITFALMALIVPPALSLSPWFASAFQTLHATLRRYGRCDGNQLPLMGQTNFNETEYLSSQIKYFLSEAAFTKSQLANVSSLMDDICRRRTLDLPLPAGEYNWNTFSRDSAVGNEMRCWTINAVMSSMLNVFKQAATNRTTPLDFSEIQFYPNATNRGISYNLTVFVSMTTLKAGIPTGQLCDLTQSISEYVRTESLERRFRPSIIRDLREPIDRMLDLQRRLYWESTRRLERLHWENTRRLERLYTELRRRMSTAES